LSDSDLSNDTTIDATDPIVIRAHRRFLKCQRYESDARHHWLMDYKFANGDEYNNYQWPVDLYTLRGEKPSLTVNEVRQHNLHIINEAKQNKADVKYRPTGAGASEAASEVYEGMYRHIANISNAQMAQGQAIEFQVQAGLGWTVIESDYVEASPKPGPDAFNQEIYISGVDDPMSVILDCDCHQPDGTGARYGFRFKNKPRDEIEEKYPKLKNRLAVANAVDGEDGGWIREDHVRQAQYWEVSEDRDELLGDDDGTVQFASKIPKPMIEAWEEELEAKGQKLKRRPIIRKSVKCHLIIGNQLVETTDVPGTAVPLVPWIGEVTVIDDRLDRKGHTRAMISAQRMINYNFSAAIEFGALQSKVPYLGPMAAFEGFEGYYDSANTVNHGWLPWNHVDDEGNTIPEPKRQEPPIGAPVYMEGMQVAKQFIMSASGQYEAELGRPGNEKSGKAINERQRQGDRATYHFIDNQALSIRRQGVIVKEWIPVIYDTARVAKIINPDKSEGEVQLDPDAAEAHSLKRIGDAIQRIFNPRIGTYEVISDVGPSYATQRQETFNAIIEILKFAPELAAKIGDILMKVADFPMSEELAERLKPGLPPEAQAQIAQLTKLLQVSEERGVNTHKLLESAMQQVTEQRLEIKAKDTKAETDAFKADTERVGMILDAAVKADPLAAMTMIRETAQQAIDQFRQDNLGPVRLAAAGNLAQDATGGTLPGAAGEMPIATPDLGEQAARPGGESP
jgi:portal protein